MKFRKIARLSAPFALLLGAAATAAQDGPSSLLDRPQIVLEGVPETMSPALLDRMCSERGVMQYEFGQTGVPLSSTLEAKVYNGIGLSPLFAPFDKAQPRATEWSGKFMEMVYSKQLGTGTEVEDGAWTFVDELASILEESGWTPVTLTFDNTPLYLMTHVDAVSFEKISNGSPNERVLLSLSYALGELTLTCGRDDLLKQHAGEVFGDLPAGTPRPVVPGIDVPQVARIEQCADPEFVAEIIEELKDLSSGQFISAMLARTSYRDRLTTWMLWKLEESGKITSMELVDLTLKSAGDASPEGNPFAAFEMIFDLVPIVEQVSAAEESGDAVAMCESLVPFQDFIKRADAITLAQTEAVHRTLQAEANRLGVSLD